MAEAAGLEHLTMYPAMHCVFILKLLCVHGPQGGIQSQVKSYF